MGYECLFKIRSFHKCHRICEQLGYECFADICCDYPQTWGNSWYSADMQRVKQTHPFCSNKNRLTETLIPPHLLCWKMCFCHTNLNTAVFISAVWDHFGFCVKHNDQGTITVHEAYCISIVSFHTYKLGKLKSYQHECTSSVAHPAATPPSWSGMCQKTKDYHEHLPTPILGRLR